MNVNDTKVQVTRDAIIIDRVGQDWKDCGAHGEFYAQRMNDPNGGEYAFGDTYHEALVNLLTGKGHK